MPCSQGSQARLLVEPGASPHTFDASSERYDFLYETVQDVERIIGARGITGSRSNISERTRIGAHMPQGRLSMYLAAGDLDLWLPRILGGSESLDSFPLAESLPAFGLLIDKVGNVYEYKDCYVNRAIFRGQATPTDGEPELIEMILEIVGLSSDNSTAWPGGAPALSVVANRQPYIMADSTLTLVSASRPMIDFVLVIDNHIQPRWTNSLTPTALCPQDRTVMLRTTNPFTSTEFSALVDVGIDGDTSASLAFALGGLSTTFTFGNLQWADEDPVVQGKREIPLTLTMIARKESTTDELVVTNDSVA